MYCDFQVISRFGMDCESSTEVIMVELLHHTAPRSFNSISVQCSHLHVSSTAIAMCNVYKMRHLRLPNPDYFSLVILTCLIA